MTLDDLQPEERRVILAARKRPITGADFNGITPTIDGGAPHTRLPARICSLKEKGYEFADQMVQVGGKRMKEYTLVREASTPPTSVGFAEALRTLDVPMGGPSSPYSYGDDDGEEWAA